MVDVPQPQVLVLHWACPDADFRYWSKVGYWSLDESIALLLGKSPSGVNWKSVYGFVRISDFAREYARLRDLALTSEAMNWGQTAVPPSDVLKWAVELRIAVPSGLLAAMEARQAKRHKVGHAQRKPDPLGEPAAGLGELPPSADVEPRGAQSRESSPPASQEAGVAEAPPAATVGAAETPQQRRERLRRRRDELKAEGLSGLGKQLAAEEGVSPKRLRAILKR